MSRVIPLTPVTPRAPKPEWLKVKAPGSPSYLRLKGLMRDLKLHTVCEEARCPNIGECWTHGTATFMILGDICTRACGYCAVGHGRPHAVDAAEPARVADAVATLDLAHVVVTSVDRDDVAMAARRSSPRRSAKSGGARPAASIEVLIPDFQGKSRAALSGPRCRARHPESQHRNRAAALQARAVRRPLRTHAANCSIARARYAPRIATKSGIMLGLGEEWDEIVATLRDLRAAGCAILTLGQYLRPSPAHLPMTRYYHPDEFRQLKDIALEMGFAHVESGPLVRSSYHAHEQADGFRKGIRLRD